MREFVITRDVLLQDTLIETLLQFRKAITLQLGP